ncbi:MAG: polysaccharide pyruvyl transferase family protein [Candidatus Margulisiibacteriota bacterium]|jgi:polysaccharide pyruvyl transferase WcaK-like protein
MKIAQIGWAGNANWGDERMFYCLKKFFYPHELVKFKNFQDADKNIDKVNSCDYVLIGGGGLIIRGFNEFAKVINKIIRPISCVGVSVEVDKINVDMMWGMELLKRKCDFIYVRDLKSKEMFNNHYKVIVGPDITFLYPFKSKVHSGNLCALNLRYWPWWDFEYCSKLDLLFNKLYLKFSFLYYIYPFKKWNEFNCVKIIKNYFENILPVSFYHGIYGLTDVQILSRYFANVKRVNVLKSFRQAKYLIGMRFHSLVFSTQMGVPFISLSYEPKNINYCNEIGCPELSVSLKEYKNLKNRIDYMVLNYDYIQYRLLNYSKTSQMKCEEILTTIKNYIEKTC